MASYWMNGPITLCVVLFGSLLNILTIYVLSTFSLSPNFKHRSRTSILASTNNSKKWSSHIKPANYAKSRTNSLEDPAASKKLSTTCSINGKRQHAMVNMSPEKAELPACQPPSPLAMTPPAVNHNPSPKPSLAGHHKPFLGYRPRVYTFFLWLVISDTALLISAMLMYSVPTLFERNPDIYVHFSSIYYLMSNTALTASVWLMCALIFDRYRTVCRGPFVMLNRTNTNGGWIGRRRKFNCIHVVLCIICILALGFSMPRLFELELEFDPTSKEYFLVQTNLVRNKFYMIGYRIVGGLLLYSLLPYVVLFIFSFKVWLVMREASVASLKISVVQNSPATHYPSLAHKLTKSTQINEAKKAGRKDRPDCSKSRSVTDSEKILFCVIAKRYSTFWVSCGFNYENLKHSASQRSTNSVQQKCQSSPNIGIKCQFSQKRDNISNEQKLSGRCEVEPILSKELSSNLLEVENERNTSSVTLERLDAEVLSPTAVNNNESHYEGGMPLAESATFPPSGKTNGPLTSHQSEISRAFCTNTNLVGNADPCLNGTMFSEADALLREKNVCPGIGSENRCDNSGDNQ
ncbi:7 transmembrane receptor (rhodopsin family) domain-containing protein [Ditylenchus destructor]|uniref:7 transmembrane receptor (Rhodopsin family) domain-containing protein n=1 Tax=Ditylenchus destructor TaxID=166010 RepID=A0AAD4RCM2_9BILA|nr:7 transmembrane receptor (rhodopsin family) domain-containing protein [Ditylenchus destructor]